MNRDAQLAALRELSAAYGGEALFRPSSIDRTINCVGSVRLGARAPRKRTSNVWQLEGSAAHRVSEMALKGERAVDEWTDRMVRLDKEGLEGVFFTEEMREGVEFYLDVVLSDVDDATEAYTEYVLCLAALDPTDPLLGENRGTADRIHLHRAARTLKTIDLKFGRGVMVSAETPQLRNYSLMAIAEFDCEGGWEKAVNVVVQPRAGDPRQRLKVVEYDPNDLLDSFLGRLHAAMEAALEPDPPLTPGTWCRWCPARSICPALRDQAMFLADPASVGGDLRRAGDALGPLPPSVFVGTIEEPRPPVPAKGQVVLPPATDMAPADIGRVLSMRHLWDSWIESVEHRAVLMLREGVAVPGWALDRRSGHRKWKLEDVDVQKALLEEGVKVADMYTEQNVGWRAQMERLLPPARRGIVEGMVERPLGDAILVPADRVRKAIPPTDPLGPIPQSQD